MTVSSIEERSTPVSGGVIVDLRAYVVHAPIGEPVRLSFGTLSSRRLVLVEIELENGMIGIGESWVNWPPWAHVDRVAAFEQGIRPLIMGGDPGDISAIHDLLVARLDPMGRQADAVGPMYQAISGVDLALWDLAGKLAEQSVVHLCGGSGATVPVYASSIGPGSDIESTCSDLVDHGFDQVKVRVGFDRETDRDLLRRVRKCAGDGFGIIADANRAWTLGEAEAMTGVLMEYGVDLVEEPLRDPDLAAIEVLFESTGLPVAVGENLYEEEDFIRFADSPAIGALQPDVTKNGGFSPILEIAARIARSGCALMPHCYGGPLGFMASVHLMAGLGTRGSIEFPIGPMAPFWGMVGGPPAIHDGVVDVPSGPGFGFHLDEEWTASARNLP
ncbi:mandelate racemase/muconate lactonizing enzyme family protein [bacterium]|nr:mandelate racemase/muconate lactonizing enzyme family protein [bacterium]